MYAEEKWQRILLENGFSGPKNSNDEIKKKLKLFESKRFIVSF